ncbi:MAG: hypothetical protein KIY12_09975 [Thermoplasmata archaeon]|uniref:Uncharacterized protein n=1 Tax=Candidatus Sysuiplasma superficiale TaxID=2823368 RepID=A0A8J8CE33_9ARCH|nr:hypothetical protein [Candidatus Sysuiplasma superficiale]MBX8645025.1 hypothetical protein [Candidatus Sysuiplasma superficiale]MCL4346839.1 hypothetical protein [Candidatus Thermoplasmatota archaeon]MCL5437218.1 hypothetical protein [Candidatus Thermoplasmatota archaeon]
MSGRFRNFLIFFIVIVLVAVNIYTAASMSVRQASSYPGYPSVMLAYYGGNITLLIHGALGPYLYRNITVSVTYWNASGVMFQYSKYGNNVYYLGFELHTEHLNMTSSALDLSASRIYYFNATVTVNESASGSTLVKYIPRNGLHVIVLGQTPYVSSMEGRSDA